MVPKLTTIILNYKNPEDTLACLKALKSADLGDRVDYLIVDNSADSISSQKIRALAPKTELIVNRKNIGFAGGNNIGIRIAIKRGAKYILIINPDVRVGKNFFKPLLKHFTDSEVGIVAPAIKHTQKNKTVYGLDGQVDWNLAKPEHRNLSSINNLKPIKSQFVTFACVIISADTFIKTGLLDDGYFMYFEDVDYCLTAQSKGFDIILDPSVTVAHRTSSSFKNPTGKLPISFRSHLRFIFKWLKLPSIIRPLIYILLLYPYLYLLWTYHSLKYKDR